MDLPTDLHATPCFGFRSGVTDAAEAQAGIEFAKKFELIKGDESKRLRLQEVDLSDESSIAEGLPRFHFPPSALSTYDFPWLSLHCSCLHSQPA